MMGLGRTTNREFGGIYVGFAVAWRTTDDCENFGGCWSITLASICVPVVLHASGTSSQPGVAMKITSRWKSHFSCLSRDCHGPEVCQQMLTNNESWQRDESQRCVDHRFMFLWINERSESQHRRQRQICRLLSRAGWAMFVVSAKRRKNSEEIFDFSSRLTHWINEPFFFARQVGIDGHLIGDGMRVLKW